MPRIVLFSKRKEKERTTEAAWPRIPSHIANTAAASAFFYSCSARSCPFVPLPSKLLSFLPNKIKIKKMQHYSKRSSFAEKVFFSKKKKEKRKKRDLTTLTSHFFSHCMRCSLRFFLPLQLEKREKRPFGPLLASPRFSLQLQDFAAVSMETAALRVQKAKSCSRVTRALDTWL